MDGGDPAVSRRAGARLAGRSRRLPQPLGQAIPFRRHRVRVRVPGLLCYSPSLSNRRRPRPVIELQHAGDPLGGWGPRKPNLEGTDRNWRRAFARSAWLDRDLSWLEFNRRVLAEALDERTPLLERLKFLGIFTSNLAELFMKRVGAMRTRA